MKRISIAFSIVLTTLVAFAFSSCATARSYDPSIPAITITQATVAELKGFGRNFSENPYLEPVTLVRGKLNEFFVLKLQFNLPTQATIEIIAEARVPEGKEKVKIYDAPGFTAFWWANTIKDNENDAQYQRKITVIERSTVPSMNFTQRAGLDTLYLPIVGRNPIPRPMSIFVQVYSSTGESATFKYQLE